MRAFVACLVLCVTAVVALAGDLTTTSSALSTAMADRVTAIGKAARGSPEKSEQKQLKKAGKALRKFKGVLDVKGVTALLKTGKSIFKSGTADAATAVATGDLLGCVVDGLAEQEAQLIADATVLLAPTDKDTFQQFIDDARAQIAIAADEATPPNDAFAAIKVALVLYTKAGKFVRKEIKRLDAELLPVLQFPFAVQNRNGVKFTVQQVSFELIFVPQGGGEAVRVQSDFRDHEDPLSEFTLPYVLVDRESQFEIYPTLYRAIEAVAGPNPQGTIVGVIRFKSTKHGKANIPVDDFLFAP